MKGKLMKKLYFVIMSAILLMSSPLSAQEQEDDISIPAAYLAIDQKCINTDVNIYNMCLKEEFMKVCNSYNFATIYKFFLDHNAINGEFTNKDLYDIGVMKKYKPSEDGFTMQEIRPEDKEFFDESYNAMTIVPASSTDSVSYNIDMPEGDSEEIKDKE